VNAYREAAVARPKRFDLTIRLFRPVVVLVPWALFAIACVVARLNTHSIAVHCAATSCEVIERRMGREIARRTVEGDGRITLRPRADGDTDAMLGDRFLVTFPRDEVHGAFDAFVRRAVREVKTERACDRASWKLAALILFCATACGLWFARRRIVVDYDDDTLVLPFSQSMPLRRVVGIHGNADRQIIVNLDDGDRRVVFPGGRSDREVARNVNAIRAAIHRYDDND